MKISILVLVWALYMYCIAALQDARTDLDDLQIVPSSLSRAQVKELIEFKRTCELYDVFVLEGMTFPCGKRQIV